MRMIATGVMALAVAACAADRGSFGAHEFDVYRAEGEALANRRCGACHATDLGTYSPRPPAPPFPQLGIRFNQISWERVMAEIAGGGHGEMPPLELPPDEVRRIKAYIDGLRQPGRRD
jgi:mono/diheme cytochrome c family protein